MTETKYKEIHLGPKRKKIPVEWNFEPVDSFSTKVTDGTHSTPNYTENGVPFLSTKNLKPFANDFDFSDYVKHITQEDHEELVKRAPPEKGDILISKSGTIGRTQKIRTDMEFSIFVGLALIKPEHEKVDSDYLEQFFNAEFMQSVLNIKAPGSTRKTLNVGTLKKQNVILPPLPEQRRIAEILSTVDEAIQQTDEIIEASKELKKGLMQDLLTKGIGHDEFKELRIGPFKIGIPEEWEETTVEDACVNRDKERVPVKEKKRDNTEGDIPYYGATGIIDYVNDYLFDSELLLVAEDGQNLLSRARPLTYLVDGKVWVNNHAHVLEATEDFDREFLKYYFDSLNYEPFVSGTAQPKLNQKELNSLKVPKPPLDEQREIAERLSVVDEKIRQEEKYREKLEELKKGLMQDLLNGEVRVERK